LKYNTGEKFRRVADELFDGVIGDLARALKMKPESFSKYTSGRTHPGWKMLKRLLGIGVNVNWFLYDIPPMLIRDIPHQRAIEPEITKEVSAQTTNYVVNNLSNKEYPELGEQQWEEIGKFLLFLKEMPITESDKRRLLESFIVDILSTSQLEDQAEE
jgi:hypothetical protein